MPSSRSQSESNGINQGPAEKILDRLWYLLLTVTAISWTFISWLKWPDIVTDYPISLYIAWRLAEGDVLYRDFHYLYGPLSSYLHAGIFTLFGTGFSKLALFNLGLVAGLTLLTFKLFRKFSDSHTAGFASLTLIMLFAFAHYFKGGFNLICPYQYETTHGLMLSLAGCYLFCEYTTRPSQNLIRALGFVTGLVFLTKVEVFLAWAICQTAGWAWLFYSKNISGLNLRSFIMSFGGFSLLPVVGFAVYFACHMPWLKAIEVLFLPYKYVIASPIPSLPLYRWLMGLEPLGANLIRIATWVIITGIVSGAAMACNHLLSRSPKAGSLIFTGWALLFSSIAVIFFDSVPWLDFLSGIQLLIAGFCIFKAMDIWKQIKQDALDKTALGEWVFALFSLALLAKCFLNISAHHFGFFLAVPATLLTVKILLHNMPALGQRLSGNQDSTKPLMMIFLAIVLMAHGALNFIQYQKKGYPVGWGQEIIYDYVPAENPRGKEFQEMMKFMKLNMLPGETLAVLPAGGPLFNYILKTRNPVPQFAIVPWDHYLLGPDALRDALVNEPPDWILFMKIRFSGMGLEFFGDDFGKDSVAWISNNYIPVYKVGNPFYTDEQFGIQALHLKHTANTEPQE